MPRDSFFQLQNIDCLAAQKDFISLEKWSSFLSGA